MLLTKNPATEVVVITAFATISTAVEAIQRGARDYLPKPFTPAQIRHIVDRVAERRQLEREVNGAALASSTRRRRRSTSARARR